MHLPSSKLVAFVAFAILAYPVNSQETGAKGDAKSPDEEYMELESAFKQGQQVLSKALQAAATEDDRRRVGNDYIERQKADADAMVSLIKKHPNDPVVFKVFQWILLHDRLQNRITDAVNAIGDAILASDDVHLHCEHLYRYGSSDDLIRKALRVNPHRNVQGMLRYQLGISLMARSERGKLFVNRDAEAVFTEVLQKYADVPFDTGTLGTLAQAALDELRGLAIGMKAPEIEGKDLNDKLMKLSDFRGKVVLLTFWATWCGACVGDLKLYQELITELEGQPFVVLGICADLQTQDAKSAVEENQLTIRSWWDGGQAPGPVSKKWNVRAVWPMTYLIDAQGVIRYKGDDLRSSSVARDAEGKPVPVKINEKVPVPHVRYSDGRTFAVERNVNKYVRELLRAAVDNPKSR